MRRTLRRGSNNRPDEDTLSIGGLRVVGGDIKEAFALVAAATVLPREIVSVVLLPGGISIAPSLAWSAARLSPSRGLRRTCPPFSIHRAPGEQGCSRHLALPQSESLTRLVKVFQSSLPLTSTPLYPCPAH
jgi:hypothetical protein